MPSRNLTILLLAVVISFLCYQRAARTRYSGAIADAMGQIDLFYVEPVDRRKLFEGSMRGMVQQLDSYSGYISPDEYRQLKEEIDQEFGGVGMVVDKDPKTRHLIVMSPLIDTPAYNAGVRAGDTILEIEGQPTEEIDLLQSVELMRGKPGTQVALKLLPYSEQQPRDVTLTRQIIPVQSVYGDTRHPDGTWNYALEQYPQIGYVRIISFGDATPEELKKALQTVLPNVNGLILDLRGNAGGLLEAAVATCDMFLPEGNIVSVKSRGGRAEHRFQAKSGNVIVRPDLVVAVLVDGFSASASEIVAACLQDHHCACLIGQRSWGKGTVQRVIELEGGRSALKLTTATYWRPSGKNIHRSSTATEQDAWGVQPDAGYEVKLDEDQYLRFLRSRRQRDGVQLSATRSSAPGNSRDNAGSSGDAEVETDPATSSPAASTSESSAEGSPETGLYDPQLERAIQYLLEKTNPQARLDAA